MKLMVYNTQHCQNYITKKIDFPLIADIIMNSGADFVGLNEIRGDGPSDEYCDQISILSQLTGFEHSYFGDAICVNNKGLYGNAFLSKIPVLNVEKFIIPESKLQTPYGREQRCLIKAKLQNGLTVLVIHFGLNVDEQEMAVKTVLENIENEKCVLMGDFNVLPDNDILAPIRNKMIDTASFFKEPLLSFPSDNPDRKIDYIFVSKDLEVKTADIPAIIGSDHRPYIVDIDF